MPDSAAEDAPALSPLLSVGDRGSVGRFVSGHQRLQQQYKKSDDHDHDEETRAGIPEPRRMTAERTTLLFQNHDPLAPSTAFLVGTQLIFVVGRRRSFLMGLIVRHWCISLQVPRKRRGERRDRAAGGRIIQLIVYPLSRFSSTRDDSRFLGSHPNCSFVLARFVQ